MLATLQFIALGETSAVRIALRACICLNVLSGEPPQSQAELARLLKVGQGTVSKHGKVVRAEITAFLKEFLQRG